MSIKIDFKEKYVAFIDVLGFTEKVNSDKEEDKKHIENYFNLLDDYKAKLEEVIKAEQTNIELFAISDSIILTAPNTPDEFYHLLIIIRYLQGESIINGILLRGGISFGEIYTVPKKNILVGKGFLKAYSLEELALFPRIIIEPSIIPHVNNDYHHFIEFCNKTEMNTLVHDYNPIYSRLTENDATFISYAHYIVETDIRRNNIFYDSRLYPVLNFIKQGLYGKQKNLGKYRWLKKYFHESVEEMKKFKPKEENQGIHREEYFDQAIKFLDLMS